MNPLKENTINYFTEFSLNYANGITAITACGALILTVATFLYLKREYTLKYRAYIDTTINLIPRIKNDGFSIDIIPRNIGSYPCEVKFSKIILYIGDEIYPTPDTKKWILIPPNVVKLIKPAGHINKNGISKIREKKYKKNKIKITYDMDVKSIVGRFKDNISYKYEIDVQGETAQVLFL